MTGLLGRLTGFLSGADAGISVPAMDGVLKPNNALETANRHLELPGMDNLALMGGQLVASSANALFAVTSRGNVSKSKKLSTFAADIGFVTALPDGALAVGVSGQGVHVGRPGKWRLIPVDDVLSNCLTSAAMLPDGQLAITVGSRNNSASDWKRDLMEHGSSGCVITLDMETGNTRVIAENLAYPNGVCMFDETALAVSESWRHRVVNISANESGQMSTLLEDIPAYPARLSPAGESGFWLALFAPRRQLFELVLKEDDYRKEMMVSIDPSEWVGPTLQASGRPEMPLQQGAVRQMGILKPWAPSSSYGLVVKCDAKMRPVQSWHSRADGERHGVTSVCETDAGVFVAAKGAGLLLEIHAAASGAHE